MRLDEIRSDEPLMSRIAATLGIVALVFLAITLLRISGGYVFAAPQATPSSYPSDIPTDAPARAANPEVWASLVAACMRGDQFIWQDPHTGSDFVAFCHVEELGRVGR